MSYKCCWRGICYVSSSTLHGGFLPIPTDAGPYSDLNDIWRFPVAAKTFSVSLAYRMLMGDSAPIPAISWLWKACNQLKHKIFFWLLLNNRLNTRAFLQRKHFFIEDYSCVMCDQFILETRDHLFSTANLLRPVGSTSVLTRNLCWLEFKTKLQLWRICSTCHFSWT